MSALESPAWTTQMLRLSIRRRDPKAPKNSHETGPPGGPVGPCVRPAQLREGAGGALPGHFTLGISVITSALELSKLAGSSLTPVSTRGCSGPGGWAGPVCFDETGGYPHERRRSPGGFRVVLQSSLNVSPFKRNRPALCLGVQADGLPLRDG